jgi:hypothetical protein
MSPIDYSGARDNHGDRVIADALAWRGLQEFSPTPVEVQPAVPPGSFLARQQEAQRRKQQREYW